MLRAFSVGTVLAEVVAAALLNSADDRCGSVMVQALYASIAVLPAAFCIAHWIFDFGQQSDDRAIDSIAVFPSPDTR